MEFFNIGKKYTNAVVKINDQYCQGHIPIFESLDYLFVPIDITTTPWFPFNFNMFGMDYIERTFGWPTVLLLLDIFKQHVTADNIDEFLISPHIPVLDYRISAYWDIWLSDDAMVFSYKYIATNCRYFERGGRHRYPRVFAYSETDDFTTHYPIAYDVLSGGEERRIRYAVWFLLSVLPKVVVRGCIFPRLIY